MTSRVSVQAQAPAAAAQAHAGPPSHPFMRQPFPPLTPPVAAPGHGQAVAVSIDARWRPLLNRACELKEALDHLLRWPVQAARNEGMSNCLAVHGLRAQDAEAVQGEFRYSFPDHFAGALLGSWFGHHGQDRAVGWCSIPPWAVLGWVRKDAYKATVDLSATMLQETATQVDAQQPAERITTYGVEGIPLFWAGEGKNRTQLFRLANLPRNAPLLLYPRPRLERFCVRRLRIFPGIAVLEYHSGERDILPFADLSIELLCAMGVRHVARPSLAALWTLWSQLGALHGWRQAARLVPKGASAVRLALLKESRR